MVGLRGADLALWNARINCAYLVWLMAPKVLPVVMSMPEKILMLYILAPRAQPMLRPAAILATFVPCPPPDMVGSWAVASPR